jgi:hypothetical protein
MLDPVYLDEAALDRLDVQRAKLFHSLHNTPEEVLQERRKLRMATLDAYPEGWRHLVHTHGMRRVERLIRAGYTLERAQLYFLAREMELEL